MAMMKNIPHIEAMRWTIYVTAVTWIGLVAQSTAASRAMDAACWP